MKPHCNAAAFPTTRRRFLGSATLTAALATAVPNVVTARAYAQSASAELLRYASPSGPSTLDPHMAGALVEMEVVNQLFEAIVTLDDKYNPKLLLASKLTISPDATTYTFRLRDDVIFQNGKKMTAADVLGSFQRYLAISPNSAILKDATLAAPDPNGFVITFPKPNPTFLNAMATPLYPLAILPEEQKDAPPRATGLVGTGPFQLRDWQKDSYLLIEKFDQYQADPSASTPDGYAGKKTVDLSRVRYNFLPEANVRVAALQTGEADVASSIPPPLAKRFGADKKITKQETFPWAQAAFILNSQNGLTSNPLIRRAIQAVVDVDDILAATDMLSRRNPSLLYPASPYYQDQPVQQYYSKNNPDEARALLREAGYKNETIRLQTNSNYPFHRDAILVLAEAMKAAGMVVLPDEIARARITLESLLPRESASKEIDAALLSIISFPAFAVENLELRDRTRNDIINKLAGKYGCKRFLRDGHQTVLEDTKRLHYEPWELKQFEDIECEWPLFFTYLVLDGLFYGQKEEARFYQELLEYLVVERDGLHLLPELYYVPEEHIEAEKSVPQTQPRLPNENVPLVWAQSLYFLSEMLSEGLLATGDIDPLGRHLRIGRHREPLVQIALLAEDEELQLILKVHGIETETPKQVEPIQVRQSKDVIAIYSQIGRNDKLGLTGRPPRSPRSLTTSRIFRIGSQTVVFLPSFLNSQQFYLTLDYHFLLDQFKGELAYIHKYWSDSGRPTLTLMLTHTMLEVGSEALLNLMQELKDGVCNGVQVKLGRLNQLMLTAGIERINYVENFEFSQSSVKDAAPRRCYLGNVAEKNWQLGHTQEFQMECETNLGCLLETLQSSENIYEQIELLQTLTRLQGLEFDTGFGDANVTVTVGDLLDEVYTKAAELGLWAVVRRAAGLRQMTYIALSDVVTSIVVRGKQIAVGKAYSEASLMTVPLSHNEIVEKINQYCREDIGDRVLTQEILIYLSNLIKSEPELFKGLLTLRVGYLILLITSEIAQKLKVTQDEAYEYLMQLSPFEVKTRLQEVLFEYAGTSKLLRQQESLHLKQKEIKIDWVLLPKEDEASAEDWRRFRQAEGTTGRVPQNFFKQVWLLMEHCKGLVIGDKLERRNRLDSEVMLSEMTPGEKNFALKVEHLLNKIEAPEYRQLCIETLMELATIASNNLDLQIEEYIVLDVLIGHAVRLAWLEKHPSQGDRYDEDKASAWRSFYNTSPRECASYIVKAFRFLSEVEPSYAA